MALMWIPEQGIQTQEVHYMQGSAQTHSHHDEADYSFGKTRLHFDGKRQFAPSLDPRGPSHFDSTRLRGHSYARTSRPQTNSGAIVTETIQNPYSGNALTSVQVDKRDIRNNMMPIEENQARYAFLESSGWFPTSDIQELEAAGQAYTPPPQQQPRTIPLTRIPNPMDGIRLAGSGFALSAQQQSQFAAGFDRRSKLQAVHPNSISHMTDYEYNNYGYAPAPIDFRQGQPQIQNNLLNPASNRTWQQQIAPPAPWEGQGRHKQLLLPYQDYNNYSSTMNTAAHDQFGRQVSGSFDPAAVEIDPQLHMLPENHPLKLRAKHDYAARVKNKVYPQTMAQNIARGKVADTIIYRDLPPSFANA